LRARVKKNHLPNWSKNKVKKKKRVSQKQGAVYMNKKGHNLRRCMQRHETLLGAQLYVPPAHFGKEVDQVGRDVPGGVLGDNLNEGGGGMFKGRIRNRRK